MEEVFKTARSRLAVSPVRATVAALSANFVGIGLARFGYTPLIPALIAAHWFPPSAAVYLGAANLAGYLAGALGARAAAIRIGPTTILRTAMLLTCISLLACAFPLGFAWYFVWRFVSGCTGGILMALAAPYVMQVIAPERRGLAGGAIFTGVGLGIAASGTLVPILISWGLAETWLGLAATASMLTAITWTAWPSKVLAGSVPVRLPTPRRSTAALRALYVEYALNAVGLVPHMVFLVDFVARGLDRGLDVGASYWIIFGAGALVGPLIGGHVGDRIGFRATLRLAFLVQMLAVAVPLLTISGPVLALSSFIVGAFVPGIVAITIGRTRELIPDDPLRQAAAWAYCTTAFAIGQAVAGYVFSYIFVQAGNGYSILFGLAAAALLTALIIDLLSRNECSYR